MIREAWKPPTREEPSTSTYSSRYFSPTASVVPGGGSRPRGSEGEFHQWFGEGVYALTGSYGTGSADGTTSDMLAVVFAGDEA
jgi:hypothetical protein